MTTTTEAPATVRHYIGLDPSLTGFGVAILGDDGRIALSTISTTPKQYKTRFHRIRSIVTDVWELVKDVANQDVSICIERPFVNPKNMNEQQDLIVLSYAVREKLYWGGLTWKDVAPMSLKKFVCGSGKAEKSMMLMKVYQHWDVSAGNDNEGDAAALAYLAKAAFMIQDGADMDGWPLYQREVARKVLAGE